MNIHQRSSRGQSQILKVAVVLYERRFKGLIGYCAIEISIELHERRDVHGYPQAQIL